VQVLLDAFDRVSQGNSELLLVAGYSGVGKTAVVNEAHKPITEKRGYFIKGKFDQFQRNIPFFAFVQAFRDLMRQLLAESDAQLESWKNQILDAVGENGQVIIEVIPELEAIIGKQPSVPQLEGSAAQNRFNLLFPKFVGVFLSYQHPLTIFIDDLQWADSASLSLLKLLINSSQAGYLLILGAYRDNEVFPAHPLMLTLEEIQQNNAALQTLTLAPLDEVNINRLVADTLLCSAEIAASLSELIYQKTGGNPFFTTQFLKGLHQDNWIVFDSEARYWQCDFVRVRQLALTDNVVEFMVGRLHKLPQKTQNALKLAACIGAQFDLATLAVVCEESQEQVAADLWPALQEYFVIPKSQTYKFFQGDESEETDIEELAVEYRFLHDRVQQAAYSLIQEEEKQLTHLKIGQLLLGNTPPDKREENIFTIVNQLNYGVKLIEVLAERDELASLNLMAGSKALASTAYGAALRYLTLGIKLLSADSWVEKYQLALALYEKAIEAEYLNTNFERVAMLAEVVIERGKTMLDKAKAYDILIQSYMAKNQAIEALEFGLSTLAKMGYYLDRLPEDGNLVVELPQGDLANIPIMKDPSHLAALQLITSISSPAFVAKPELWPSIVFTLVNLCVKHGYSDSATGALALYGTILCGRGELDAGYRAGNLAMKLLDKFDAKEHKCKVYQIFHSHIRPRKKPIVESLLPLREAVSFGLETGDFEWTGYGLMIYCSHIFWTGANLDTVSKEQQQFLDLAIKIQQEVPTCYIKIWKQTTENLQGLAKDKCRLIGNSCNELELLESLVADNNITLLFQLYLAKTIILYLLEETESALSNAILAEENLAGVTGMIVSIPHNFYYSLSLLARYPNVSQERQKQYLELVAAKQQQMQNWAVSAPTNYQHQFDLVEAERYRVNGQPYRALEFYDRAIAGAKENGYIQEEALANELTAILQTL